MNAGIFIMTMTAHIIATGISAVKLDARALDFISDCSDQEQCLLEFVEKKESVRLF